MNPSTEELSAAFRERLQERRLEIERTALAKVFAISEPSEEANLRYAEGLRAAVAAAVDFGIAVIEGDSDAPVPVELLAQARLAARNGISLDTVLRRYFAGYALLEQIVREEAAQELEPNRPALERIALKKAPAFERLIALVTQEYRAELAAAPRLSPEHRRVARIKRLLAGELVEPLDLAYELDQRHVGLIAEGPGALSALRELAQDMDWNLLTAVNEGTIWGWLGTRHRHLAGRLELLRAKQLPEGLVLALGEPGEGLAGWRRSHLQARAGIAVARAAPGGLVRYREVALLAAALRDELLASSLKEIFVHPLEQGGDGPVLCETLNAYLVAERNISSAAASLEVSRHTVASRLRTIEDRLDWALRDCGPCIEVALQLRELETHDQ